MRHAKSARPEGVTDHERPLAPALPAVLHEVPAEFGTALLVGHNPGLQEIVLTLAGDGQDDTLPRVRTAFPTSAIAVLSWRGARWQDLPPAARCSRP